MGWIPRLLRWTAPSKVTSKGFQVLVVAAVDLGHRTHPIAQAIMSHRTEAAYANVFQVLKIALSSVNVGIGEDRAWRLILTDAEDALVLGARSVFGRDLNNLMCWFHLLQAVDRNVKKHGLASLKSHIFDLVKQMHYTISEDDFKVRLLRKLPCHVKVYLHWTGQTDHATANIERSCRDLSKVCGLLLILRAKMDAHVSNLFQRPSGSTSPWSVSTEQQHLLPLAFVRRPKLYLSLQ
jgi:hypothetical protein